MNSSLLNIRTMHCDLKSKLTVLAAFGIATATFGIIMYFIFPVIMENEIKKKLVLKNGTEGFKNWENIPVPIYLHFYLFNVTNINEIYSLKKKPALQQLGPYTFREKREKVVLSINENGTITYKQIRFWYFDAEKTNGSLDDIVTTLNVPMVAAAAVSKRKNKGWMYVGLTGLFKYLNSSWFVHKTARQLLFDGYQDPLINLAKKFASFPYDKFGWFYKRNGTDDGIVNVFTGEDNIEKLDLIDNWDGKRETAAFQSPCNMINGSAGDMWSPLLTPESRVEMFVPDICRSMSFTYLADVNIKGLRAYRYWADDRQLDNGKYDPNNRCFCGGDICLPPGAVNVSSCKLDAPVAVSYPHFLYADSIYSEGITGMNPDPEKHRMYMDIVPELGVPIGVAARMQINIVVDPIPEIYQFHNFTKRIYFPALWFSTTALTDDDVASQLKLVAKIIPTIGLVVSLLFISTGIALAITALVISRPFLCKVNHPSYSSVAVKE